MWYCSPECQIKHPVHKKSCRSDSKKPFLIWPNGKVFSRTEALNDSEKAKLPERFETEYRKSDGILQGGEDLARRTVVRARSSQYSTLEGVGGEEDKRH